MWQEDEQKETHKLCAKIGICRHVTVFISKEIVSPMTMGFLNPCIFLPAGEIDKETLRLILAPASQIIITALSISVTNPAERNISY